ncbi:hypothetical protein PFISCL1PPCAC_4396 [Pristionchus fissidentatus]|uniref:C2H2-type domain-containing protein n=1 Tax=Pristionchus fissidentatus TaxID=1538716 RepID=A0AAV5V159_9BILA|nr:hypothetical protein PFISCL1PPCAC_4396 [Pristionchus fissidentatus]
MRESKEEVEEPTAGATVSIIEGKQIVFGPPDREIGQNESQDLMEAIQQPIEVVDFDDDEDISPTTTDDYGSSEALLAINELFSGTGGSRRNHDAALDKPKTHLKRKKVYETSGVHGEDGEKRRKRPGVAAKKCDVLACDFHTMNDQAFLDHDKSFHTTLAFSMTGFTLQASLRCPYCSTSCFNLEDLTRHMSRKHKQMVLNEAPIVLCSGCDFKCARIYEMFEHWSDAPGHRKHQFTFDYVLAAKTGAADKNADFVVTL